MNLKILLVEPNDSLRELIEKNFIREFGADVSSYGNSIEALEQIDRQRYFDLIVVRNKTDETTDKPIEEIASLFLNAIYDQQIKTPLVVIGEFEHTYKKYALVSDRLRIEELNRLILKALNLKKEDFSHLKFPDYIPYPTKYFFLMTLCPCDVFIKLSKKGGEEFVKRLRFGESFTRADLEKYEELGLKEFYILKEERELFMNGLLTQSLQNLRSVPDQEKLIIATGDSFTISSDLIINLGISPMCVAMVDQTLQQMKSQISKTDKLGQLLRKLLDNQLSFSYRRSFMISLISYTLFPKMEWGSQEQQNILLEKITMVSFFHDIYLEDEKHLKVMNQEALKAGGFGTKEKELIINHAHKAALLIQSYPKVPPGVDLILKQHHGVANGVGFPEYLTAAISPLAIFFLVVEDFVTHILETQDTSQIKNIIVNLKLKYQLPTYRKVMVEIEALYGGKK